MLSCLHWKYIYSKNGLLIKTTLMLLQSTRMNFLFSCTHTYLNAKACFPTVVYAEFYLLVPHKDCLNQCFSMLVLFSVPLRMVHLLEVNGADIITRKEFYCQIRRPDTTRQTPVRGSACSASTASRQCILRLLVTLHCWYCCKYHQTPLQLPLVVVVQVPVVDKYGFKSTTSGFRPMSYFLLTANSS